MPYSPHPRAFKTKHWRALYEAPILDIAMLKKYASNGAAFVVIDAEPWGADDSQPAEVGISLLPPLDPNFDYSIIRALPKTLDAASSFNGIETHWIRIVERERREKNRERHRYGKHYYVRSDDLQHTISGLIQSFKAKYRKALCGLPLVLTGFGLLFEFRVFSSLYPDF